MKAKVEDNAAKLSVDAAYKRLDLDKLIANETLKGSTDTLKATKDAEKEKLAVVADTQKAQLTANSELSNNAALTAKSILDITQSASAGQVKSSNESYLQTKQLISANTDLQSSIMKKSATEDAASKLSANAASTSLNLDKLVATEKLKGSTDTLKATKDVENKKLAVVEEGVKGSIASAATVLKTTESVSTAQTKLADTNYDKTTKLIKESSTDTGVVKRGKSDKDSDQKADVANVDSKIGAVKNDIAKSIIGVSAAPTPEELAAQTKARDAAHPEFSDRQKALYDETAAMGTGGAQTKLSSMSDQRDKLVAEHQKLSDTMKTAPKDDDAYKKLESDKAEYEQKIKSLGSDMKAVRAAEKEVAAPRATKEREAARIARIEAEKSNLGAVKPTAPLENETKQPPATIQEPDKGKPDAKSIAEQKPTDVKKPEPKPATIQEPAKEKPDAKSIAEQKPATIKEPARAAAPDAKSIASSIGYDEAGKFNPNLISLNSKGMPSLSKSIKNEMAAPPPKMQAATPPAANKEKMAPVNSQNKQASLSDVVSSLDKMSTQLATLIAENRDISSKMVKAVKTNSPDLHSR